MPPPFHPPTLPLVCNVWRSANASVFLPKTTPPDLAGVRCQLVFLRGAASTAAAAGSTFSSPLLITPPGTDLRGPGGGFFADVIECPAGTGRYYLVKFVDDRAKGFPNEHRIAVLQQEAQITGGWPRPTP